MAAQPEHSCVRLFSGRSWLVGVSDAPRKLRGRLHRLADAAQAPVKRLFGLLKVVFALYLGCCQNNKGRLGAATKKPRKAVPARPRAAHVRPRKSDDEWPTFPYMGPPARGTESSSLAIWEKCFGTQTPSTSRSTLLGTTKSQNRNDRLDFFWSGDLAICDLAIS